ncbi:unnamed protein product [Rotaria sp. Silwood1]|nr:unnamed protein product [Rotaria sp. Silwood1]
MSHCEMPIGQPFELPCGLKLSNRIIKTAMEESLGSGDNQPNEFDERHRGLMTDLMISSKDKIDIEKWKRYADVCQSYGTPTIVQINHAGRQSPFGKRPYRQPTIAPSRIAMSIGNNIFARTLQYFVIGTPEKMTLAQIDEAVEKFANAAEIMAKVNFADVEIHASHVVPSKFAVGIKLNSADFNIGGLTEDEAHEQIR